MCGKHFFCVFDYKNSLNAPYRKSGAYWLVTNRPKYTNRESHAHVTRDGAVVRALPSHQCGLCSILGLGVICGFSLLLVLVLAPRGFSPGTLDLPSSKNQYFQIQIRSSLSRLSIRPFILTLPLGRPDTQVKFHLDYC